MVSIHIVNDMNINIPIDINMNIDITPHPMPGPSTEGVEGRHGVGWVISRLTHYEY